MGASSRKRTSHETVSDAAVVAAPRAPLWRLKWPRPLAPSTSMCGMATFSFIETKAAGGRAPDAAPGWVQRDSSFKTTLNKTRGNLF